MNKIIYIMLGFVLAFAILLIISYDDFFSPTIEIFNEITTPTNVEQEQKKEQQQINQSQHKR